MTEEEAFLEDIRSAPEDDAPRLVYADWLEDHPSPLTEGRAEFIRLQCALARLPIDHPNRPSLAAREAQLLQEHDDTWTELAFLKWLAHPAAEYLAT